MSLTFNMDTPVTRMMFMNDIKYYEKKFSYETYMEMFNDWKAEKEQKEPTVTESKKIEELHDMFTEEVWHPLEIKHYNENPSLWYHKPFRRILCRKVSKRRNYTSWKARKAQRDYIRKNNIYIENKARKNSAEQK